MVWKSGQSYSADLRSRMLAAIDGGGAAKAVARRFQVSATTCCTTASGVGGLPGFLVLSCDGPSTPALAKRCC